MIDASQKPYDLIIVGASAAGIAAAIYAARRSLRFAVISEDVGGEVASSGVIENYPGFPETDGIALTEEFRKQLTKYAVELILPARVERIDRAEPGFTLRVRLDGATREYRAKTVIVATGVHPRLLNVPGEQEFTGKGVTYCTTCDGPLYRKKIVATVGGGNSALESAIMLAGIAERVTLLTINDAMKGEQVLIDRVHALPNVELITNAATKAILGDTVVSGLRYGDTRSGEDHQIDVQGVFIHIGFIPNADLVAHFVERNPLGEILTDSHMATNVPGLFAAGDVTAIPWKQIAIATGHGVTAALHAIDALNRMQD